jgi:hypothetical protein
LILRLNWFLIDLSMCMGWILDSAKSIRGAVQKAGSREGQRREGRLSSSGNACCDAAKIIGAAWDLSSASLL